MVLILLTFEHSYDSLYIYRKTIKDRNLCLKTTKISTYLVSDITISYGSYTSITFTIYIFRRNLNTIGFYEERTSSLLLNPSYKTNWKDRIYWKK
jgi:hypothetical protein